MMMVAPRGRLLKLAPLGYDLERLTATRSSMPNHSILEHGTKNRKFQTELL